MQRRLQVSPGPPAEWPKKTLRNSFTGSLELVVGQSSLSCYCCCCLTSPLLRPPSPSLSLLPPPSLLLLTVPVIWGPQLSCSLVTLVLASWILHTPHLSQFSVSMGAAVCLGNGLSLHSKDTGAMSYIKTRDRGGFAGFTEQPS